MPLQKTHESIKNSQHSLEIIIIAENIRTPENLGMILRVSEAFGVTRIYFAGTLGVSFTTKAKRASRNTHTLNNYYFIEDGKNLVKELKSEGYPIIALEITEFSQAIKLYKNESQKLCLVIGSEREGISEELLSQVDAAYHIPLYGNNSSINVVNALSIALYQVLS